MESLSSSRNATGGWVGVLAGHRARLATTGGAQCPSSDPSPAVSSAIISTSPAARRPRFRARRRSFLSRFPQRGGVGRILKMPHLCGCKVEDSCVCVVSGADSNYQPLAMRGRHRVSHKFRLVQCLNITTGSVQNREGLTFHTTRDGVTVKQS